MPKIAIDAALLLPEEINKICLDTNRKDKDHYFDLSKKDNYPHITLAMGVLDETDIQKVIERLEKISKKFSPLELEITEMKCALIPESKKSYAFTVKPTKELMKLHRVIIKELMPLFSCEVKNDAFFIDKDEKFNEISKHWVGKYAENHLNPENFRPHISLGCGNAEYSDFPIKFLASKLAISQLGNYCTCRKIFSLFELK